MLRRDKANHLQELAVNDYANIKKSLRVSDPLLKQALLLIRSLNPKPGSIISPRETDYIYPDVVARKITDKWVVELNSEVLPKVRINSVYEGLSKKSTDKSEKAYLKEHLQKPSGL